MLSADRRHADIVIKPKNPSRQAQAVAIADHEKVDPYRRAGTCIPAILPLCSLTRSMPAIYLRFTSARDALVLHSMLSSLPLNYFSRFKVATNHLTQGIVESLPITPLSRVDAMCNSIGLPSFVDTRALELVYSSWDLAPFAADLGYEGPPLGWGETSRTLLRCELDAFYFRLYSISRDEAANILESFPSVRREDDSQYGEFRTRRIILDIYDLSVSGKAERNEGRCQTSLAPPPADPSVAHSSGTLSKDSGRMRGEAEGILHFTDEEQL